jgi:uncharacterized protein YijF (DUF1287 family)
VITPFNNEEPTSGLAQGTGVAQPPQIHPLSTKERRLERLGAWRDQNRERLREYVRRWKAANPDRVADHRQNEYLARYKKRRRLRLRREAQRRRRAAKRWESQ